MWLIHAVVATLLASAAVALIDFPPSKDVFLVTTFSDLFALTHEPYLQDRTVVGIVSSDVTKDSYLTLYMGLLVELFEDRSEEDLQTLAVHQLQRIEHYHHRGTKHYGHDWRSVIDTAHLASSAEITPQDMVQGGELNVSLTGESLQDTKSLKDTGKDTDKDMDKDTPSAHNEQWAQEYLAELRRTMTAERVSLRTAFVLFIPSAADLSVSDATMLMLSVLPLRSVLIAIQHGKHSLSFKTLGALRSGLSSLSLSAPSVVFHMNHERPWVRDARHSDGVAESDAALLAQYAQFPLVLRNYHYGPLARSRHALYVPVRAPFYGHVLNNFTNEVFLSGLRTPASQRERLCWFRGRVSYAYDALYNAHKGDEREGERAFAASSSAERERKLLAELHRNRSLSQCVWEERAFERGLAEGERERSVEEEYALYTERLARTAISLCPSGNNPETFRLHEALELGTIPIIVRSDVPERDFLTDDLWRDYPGPVLSNWNEAPALIHTLSQSSRTLDALQLRLTEWYTQFKERARERTRERVLSTLNERVLSLSAAQQTRAHLAFPLIDAAERAAHGGISPWHYVNRNYATDAQWNIVQLSMPATPHDVTATQPVNKQSPSDEQVKSRTIELLQSSIEIVSTTVSELSQRNMATENALKGVSEELHLAETQRKTDKKSLQSMFASLRESVISQDKRIGRLETELRGLIDAVEMLARLAK